MASRVIWGTIVAVMLALCVGGCSSDNGDASTAPPASLDPVNPAGPQPTAAEPSAPAGPPQYLGRPVDYWARRLDHPQEECAVKAAWVLGRMGAGAKPAVGDLVKIIGESGHYPDLRLAAIKTLGKIGPGAKEAIPELVEILDREDPWDRRLAAMVLGKLRVRAELVLPALIKTLEDEEPWVRAGAAYGLGLFAKGAPLGTRTESVISALGKARNDESAEVRSASLYALWAIGPAAEAALKKVKESGRSEDRAIAALALAATGLEADDTLISAFDSKEADVKVRHWALTALPWESKHLPVLHGALGSDEPDLRVRAAQALAYLGPEAASTVPDLIRLLGNESRDVRAVAVYTLGEIGPDAKSAVGELAVLLRRAMEDEEADDENVLYSPAIIEALWKIGRDAVPTLMEALHTAKDRPVADEIMASLGSLGPAAVPALRKALEDPDEEFRARAALALAAIGPDAEAAVPALERLARSETPGDKTVFYGALAAILPDSPYRRQLEHQIQQSVSLSQISRAIMMFEIDHGEFSPAAWSEAGKPLLSWRVAILPYLDQQVLYEEFHLDEPWDSPHNIKLLASMPEVYHGEGQREDGKTSMMVFTGEGAAFDGTKAVSAQDVSDGQSNTIMVVEAGPDKAVPWTKPEDLPFDPEDPGSALGEVPEVGFPVVFFDGHTRILPKRIDAKRLRGLITPDGGEAASVHEP